MAETRGESEEASAEYPEHRGHLSMARPPRNEGNIAPLLLTLKALANEQKKTEIDWCGLGMVDEAVVDGVEGEFEAVRDAELVEDVVEMILDGLLGDEKFFADFLVAEALGDELDDFFFAIAEEGLFAARAGFAGLGKGFHDFGGHAVVEPDFAGVHAVNAFHQKIGGGLLEHHAARAEAHGADHVAIIFGGGENNDARGQRIEIDFFEDGEAVFIGHAQIEQKNVGLELGEELDALGAVLRFADDGDFFVGIEKLAKTFAENRVVIG